MINLNLNNQINISQVKAVKDCNTELITTNNTKQAKIGSFINTKKIELDKQSIIHLQEHVEVKETKILFTEQHPVELIKGRDDRLYNERMEALLRGRNSIEEFKEIIERNKDNQIISVKDWNNIEHFIIKFENGIWWNNFYKGEDPIVNRALDLCSERTQNKINVLKEYLSARIKAPEETKIELSSESTELSVANSEDDYTKNLLKWIDNCLNQYDKVLNKKYNSSFLQIVELSYSQNGTFHLFV